MRLTRLFYRFCLLLFLPLVITACFPQDTIYHLSVRPHTRKTLPSLPKRIRPACTSSSEQVAATTATIASAPGSCPNDEPMPLSQRISGRQLLRGDAPIWVALAASVVHPLHLAHQAYDFDGGWPLAIAWKTATSYQHPIILRAINNLTGKLLKWHQSSASSTSPDAVFLTMSPILDPRQPDRAATPLSAAEPTLRSWDTQLLIPGAGCYTVEAIWPESYWRISFSAGL